HGGVRGSVRARSGIGPPLAWEWRLDEPGGCGGPVLRGLDQQARGHERGAAGAGLPVPRPGRELRRRRELPGHGTGSGGDGHLVHRAAAVQPRQPGLLDHRLGDGPAGRPDDQRGDPGGGERPDRAGRADLRCAGTAGGHVSGPLSRPEPRSGSDVTPAAAGDGGYLARHPPGEPGDEPALLDRARAGDQAAFGGLVARYEAELRLHCYRMLGSFHDAEDVTQEVLVRAWRHLPACEGRASVRTWLYRIATNRCLTRRARPAPEAPAGAAFAPPPPNAPDVEVAELQPFPDARLGQL